MLSWRLTWAVGLAWAWAWTIRALDFLAILEDAKRGQPRRLSQTRVMVWGAMLVGGYLITRLSLTGQPIEWTDAGVIGLLTVAASVMKLARDRGRWSDDDDA